MSRFEDLTGLRFGHWIVEHHSGWDKKRNSVWFCRCDCGETKDVPSHRLKNGGSKSCGCQGRAKVCIVDGCNNPTHGNGLCVTHYRRQRAHGDPEYKQTEYDICTVDGCIRGTRSKTSPYCETHYYRLYRNGTLDTLIDSNRYECCQVCGKETGGNKFCSMRCSTRYARGLGNTKNCVVCGNQYVSVGKTCTCSDECATQHTHDISRAYYREQMDTNPLFRAKVWDAYQVRRAKKFGAGVEFVVYDDVYERDNYTCKLCGGAIDMSLRWPAAGSPSIDHAVPLSKGGEHTFENCQASHLRCNLCKNDKLYDSKVTAHGG